ncbi:protocatechuate 3,4-dioxygenase [Photobacterium jeanii]|uniref:Protocatechuate 3,4-dioxygenase n=1 Tax=Photobacterium jeanii TaxID=858640 RepID=A0A178KKX4_9GAMM|nr:protocatechuate 3,4-dioxygenase [Photobacterium jeanii]OAN17979.1 protocatechuate 3,4-dioxygenase [Photobacterium jeanii]PST92352.1 protocatechuate 3,4-dioxygenase [Photobacterium jeanii]
MKRRQFLAISAVWLAFPSRGNEKQLTPSQAEGPFYPVVAIPDRSDLVLSDAGLKGKEMMLKGQVLNKAGQPLNGIRIEIWQCDANGIYDHPQQPNNQNFDSHFAGFGSVQTDERGRYAFRTIYPVPYGPRPPHIHVKLWRGKQELLTTQLYLPEQTGNEWWGGSERQHLQMHIADSQDDQQAYFEFVLSA